MTAIQQSLVTGRQSQNRAEGDVTQASAVAINNNTEESASSIVNISWQAVMRLSAYQQQRLQQTSDRQSTSTDISSESSLPDPDAVSGVSSAEWDEKLPANITGMLLEIEQNLVQTSEPGYRHLRNLLNNQSQALSQGEQLEELIRKEKFFLGRRKAFMDSSEFQSYSQVLNQFSNILQREFSG